MAQRKTRILLKDRTRKLLYDSKYRRGITDYILAPGLRKETARLLRARHRAK